MELTEEQAAKLNRALAGEQVDLDENEAALLSQALGAPGVKPAPEEPALFSPESKSGTAVRGFGQGASYGFADELAGASAATGGGMFKTIASAMFKNPVGRALLRKLKNGEDIPDADVDAAVDDAIAEARYLAQGTNPAAVASPYEQARNQARSENARAEAANPGTYIASNIAGGIMAPGPKGGPMTIGGAVLKPWAGRALTGAGVGIVSGLGNSEGKTAGDVAKDAAMSGALGGVAAPIIGAATDKAGGALARWLEARSRQNALKAIGLTPGINDKARQLGIESADDLLALGAKARDEGGLIRPLGTPSGVAQRVEGMLDDSMSAKNSAIEELQRMAEQQGRAFDFNKLATRADDALRPAQGWDPLSRDLSGKAMSLLGKASAAQGGFPMAEQVRRQAGKSINWKAPAFGQALPEEIASQRRAYGVIADEIANQAKDVEAKYLISQGRIPHPEDLGASNQVAAMNKRISTLMDINALSNANATREVAKSPLTLPSMLGALGIAGAGAAGGHTVGGLATAAALAAAGSAARNRLPSAMTHVQHAAASALPVLSRGAEVPLIRTVNGDRLSRAYAAMLEKYGKPELAAP